MAYTYQRKGSPFWWYRIKDPATKEWLSEKSTFRVADPHGRRNAKRLADTDQRKMDEARRGDPNAAIGAPTVRAYALTTWIKMREASDLDWKTDLGRLKHHILPTIGDMPIANVRAPQIADLIHKLRSDGEPEDRPAQRTIYNIYSVLSAMFRDAQIGGLIDASPCVLTRRQLGPLTDKDPEWRASAIFTRNEAEVLISDDRIPFDRRLYYAFGLLAGLRPGEIAALRVRHYESTVEPLGRLTVALAHNTRKNRTKSTKTNATRIVPVHPTLAAILGEWLLSGYEAMTGKRPEPDDLLLPLPPDAARARRHRTGEPIRTGDYAGKRWREEDLPMLGWRAREMYAGKSTFITLAIEDGANPDVIRQRVTHAKARRNAFDGYDRGAHWNETSVEVSKLRLARRHVTNRVTVVDFSSRKLVEAAGIETTNFHASIREDSMAPTTTDAGEHILAHPRDHGLSHDRVTTPVSDEDLARALAEAVLVGDQEHARTLAKCVQERARAVAKLRVLSGGK